MQRQIEELRRRAEQGSQQLQGEAQEADLNPCFVSNFRETLFSPFPRVNLEGTCCNGS